MGMAASQARYIELTARKTDVEYQGQQINQQRMDLANQSAGLFSQLMGLVVPTAPSSSNYTTTSYTFNDGANNCTISNVQNLQGNPNYNATVSYYYTQSVYTGIAKTRTDLGARNVSGTYWLTDGATGGSAVNKTQLSQCSLVDPDYATDKAAIEQIIIDTDPTHAGHFAQDYYNPGGGIGNIYKYSAANGVTYYYSKYDLDHMPVDGSAASLTSYYAADIAKTTNVTENAYITKTDSGRYSTIQLASEPGTTLNITTTSKTDQNAYNDAVNEYTYQQQLYEQQVNNINAKTSVIQAEDRTLEMRLAQLDTEQQALSTELDSVKKVIDKNIEQTFKTFQ